MAMKRAELSKKAGFILSVAVITGLGLLFLLLDMQKSGLMRGDLPQPVYLADEQELEDVQLPDVAPTPVTAHGKIDLNTADIEQLDSLPGIGEKLAQRIITFRKQHPFKQIRDVKKVSGIGDALFDKIKDKIYVAGEPLG
ncbi:MAG: helix-hairpin-helix domain-containing protein [Ruminococcaceae bacterium]|nr:helix-hairpin-helix domain-containing protein [Oscillospiraceae bacterium]